MKVVRIHFLNGKTHEMRMAAADAEGVAGVLDKEPNGTTRINAHDGTIIVNRNHVTHVQIIAA